MSKKGKIILALSLLPQYFLIKVAKQYPDFMETYYSMGVFPVLSKLLNTVFKWIPFSVGDLLYIALIVYVIRWGVINWKRLRTQPKAWGLDVLSFASLLYFMFHLCWGFNYYRVPLHTTLHLNPKYTTAQLKSVTNQLVKKTNRLHFAITQDSLLKTTLPYAFSELTEISQTGYSQLEKVYPNFKHDGKNSKKSLFSTPLTYMGFSGYVNPLTLEAHINAVMPLNSMPTTIAHEQAHQLGYAAENEANFIGFLASIYNKDPYFNYAGYKFALRYCLIELSKRDPDVYASTLCAINPGVLEDYREAFEFWSAYNNPLEPVFKGFYSHFLKANNQSKGIESYSYVVALLVDYLEDYLED
ncbi:DUF3810 domain-containing protein [Flavobacteriaceae bacterium]|nr:DUF3810 domain-containing protein [Flavobacteriaceae bacterium]